MSSQGQSHITVCICTLKRPELLKRSLAALDQQETENLFTFSIVVADNDASQSAKQVVTDFAARSSIKATYCVEPKRNIALARNRALAHATGEYVAFIDDDEYPAPNWLCTLFKTCSRDGVDGVLGPVVPYFDQEAPRWAVAGRFFERSTHETGYHIKLQDARTGNVILKRGIMDGAEQVFRPEFGTGGEDTDFFRRKLQEGCAFIWCNEAVVYEAVPVQRCTRRYLLKRSFHQGTISLKQPTCRVRNVFKSFVALPLYGVVLPVSLLAGDHHFMKYLIKFCYHAGRILAPLCTIRSREELA